MLGMSCLILSQHPSKILLASSEVAFYEDTSWNHTEKEAGVSFTESYIKPLVLKQWWFVPQQKKSGPARYTASCDRLVQFHTILEHMNDSPHLSFISRTQKYFCSSCLVSGVWRILNCTTIVRKRLCLPTNLFHLVTICRTDIRAVKVNGYFEWQVQLQSPVRRVCWQDQNYFFSYCRCELSYRQNISSLKYHLLWKHTANIYANAICLVSPESSCLQNTTLDWVRVKPMNKPTSSKLSTTKHVWLQPAGLLTFWVRAK